MADYPDFSRLRVLVVGDVMIDRYVHGSVDRISPEAPVPVVRKLRQEDRLGGAANVAVNLRALGVRAEVAGAVGMGIHGTTLRHLLEEGGVGHRLLVRDPGRPTTLKTRVLSQSQQLLRIDQESTESLDAGIEQRLIDGLESRLEEGGVDLIVLQDYNKGVMTAGVIEAVLELGKQHAVMTAVDPKFSHFWAYRGCSLFKPNLREIQQQLDFRLSPDIASLDRAAAVLFERLACDEVMITLSEHGIYTHDGRRSAIHPTSARRIADVSGAGDTVISVAAAARAAGMPLPGAAQLANVAGAQVISRPGVVAVCAAELQREWLAQQV